MHACWARIWIAASLFATATAQGETLYQRDGVTLEGTVRMVTRGAGVCQVLAENHPPDVYEGMKANHGQPLDVWRLDFAARNGSGRRLAYLTAHLKIDSEWPPCTNWTGPEGRYPTPPQWAGSFETLQRVSGMEPGEQVSDTVYVLAFHSHEPRFENWQLDYRFAAGSVADPGEVLRESGPATVAAGLPPEIQVDLNLRKAEQALREGNVVEAREAMERLEALEREHGLEPAAEGHYRYAQAWAAAGEPQRAMAAAVRYLQAGGREAEHYTEALDLINREGVLETVPNSGAAAASRAGPGEAAGVLGVEPTQPQTLRAGESRVFDGIEFVWVPAGEFWMGSTSSEADDDERPLTQVRISRGFWLGKFEVTQGRWQGVMGSNPSYFKQCGPDCPVEQVSWDDAQAFIGNLNGRAGGNRYRLPTEAEWEYAARAGTTGDRYGNIEVIAWYDSNNGDRTHPLGRKAPNAWGLHDMLGNVWEWTQDWYVDHLPGGSVTDPRGPVSSSGRAIRGGSWGSYARNCRASIRFNRPPGYRSDYLGFRLLRTE